MVYPNSQKRKILLRYLSCNSITTFNHFLQICYFWRQEDGKIFFFFHMADGVTKAYGSQTGLLGVGTMEPNSL